MKFVSILWLLLIAPLSVAQELDYSIEGGKFYTSQGEIPEGCFGQLITELNGDDTVAAIFLNRTSLRGCVNANIPYPGGEEQDITYHIEESLGSNKYRIYICKAVDGSMGSFCDKVIVQFTNRTYSTPERSMVVLSLEKFGEW